MRFTQGTRLEARRRQRNRCGCCGESLEWLVEHAHHFQPRAQGGGGELDNCVVLCETCHHRVHQDGHFASGFVAQQDYFPFWNGQLEKFDNAAVSLAPPGRATARRARR
jgi:hypothetical protein